MTLSKSKLFDILSNIAVKYTSNSLMT